MQRVATISFLLATLTASAAAATPPVTPRVWQSIGPEGGAVHGFAQAPTDPDRLYLVSKQHGVHRSDDGGVTWTRVSTGPLLGGPVAVSRVDRDVVLEAEVNAGIFRRTVDGGVTWTVTSIAPRSEPLGGDVP